jgi:SpoVK/Ycf46/Vps4 family AAA+-type ATPase
MTANYSGSDLKNLCIAAAMGALRRGLQADPTAPNTLISMADFESAILEVPASISDSMDTVVELRKWDQMFGEGKKAKNTLSFGFAH